MKKLSMAVLALGVLALLSRAADAQTFKPDDEGFIRNWVILEPIPLGDDAATHEEGTQKSMFDKDHFTGQKDATPKAGDKVTVAGKELAWRAFQAADYAVDLEKFAGDCGKPSEKSLYLGVVYVTCEKEMPDVKLAIGSDDSSVWRVNGKEVIRAYAGRGVEKDQDTSQALTLKQGVNVLTFAVINGDGPTGACAHFTDKNGTPVKNISISLTPPAK